LRPTQPFPLAETWIWEDEAAPIGTACSVFSQTDTCTCELTDAG
jgi:hypothetical protein